MSKICIIIPVYNEALRLPKDVYFAHLRAHAFQSILFVNDGSTDGSAAILDEMSAQLPEQIFTLHATKNQGKAEAVRLGFEYLMQNKNYDILGYLDADLATPLSQINHICYSLESNDELMMAFGSRVQLFGLDIQRKTSRHYLGRIFATYVSVLLGLQIYDTQCGAKFFRNNEILKAVFQEKFVSKWFFDIEIFIRLKVLFGKEKFQKSILEIPLKKWHEQGASKLKWSDFVLSPLQLSKIKKKYRK